MAKDLFRANYKGKVMGFAYGIVPAFIDGAGKEAAEGIYSIADPSPALRLQRLREAQGAGEEGRARYLHLPGLRPRQSGDPVDGEGQGRDRHRDPRQHPQDRQQRRRRRRSTTRSTA